ncbi:MAG TPA: DUF2058 family protein [Rhodanobacter sp.]|nr:DUF2058 family protein [Rhodanobacter sp.]
MAESLRDQLLKSGIVKTLQSERPREPRRPAKPVRAGGKSPATPAKSREAQDIDLAKAYALRGQAEARERKRIEREAAEQARLRRERKLRIQQLLEGKALNKADADQVRHFEYAGKIRRVHVDAAQLAALNAGELGVVQHAGRYLLVGREVAEQVRELDAHQLAMLVAPGTAATDDDGVPDDLMW